MNYTASRTAKTIRINDEVYRRPKVASGEPTWRIRKRWDGRVGHPRQVGYLIERELEEHRFRVKAAPFKDQAGSLNGVATFQLRVTAKRDAWVFSLPQLVLGIVTLPLLIGIPLIEAAFGGASMGVKVKYEGEEYLAGAKDEAVRAERAVVIADCRVDLVGWIRWWPWRIFRDEKTVNNLARGVDELLDSLQGALPNLRVDPNAHRPAIEPSR